VVPCKVVHPGSEDWRHHGHGCISVDEVNGSPPELKKDRVTVLDGGLFLSPTRGNGHQHARDALHLTQAGCEVLNRHVVPVLRQIPCD